MIKIKIFNKCLLVKADNRLVHSFPFVQFVLCKDPFNQIGIELQWGIDIGMIRIDGWKYTSKKNLMELLDAVYELAELNGYSKIHFFDRITDKEAEMLEFYGFCENAGYMSCKSYIMEVD